MKLTRFFPHPAGVVALVLFLEWVTLPAYAMGKSPPLPRERIEFPEGFQWCVATAAHQIEGDNFNSDWWNWERENWSVSSGHAVDGWNRSIQDIALLQELNVTQYRFSIEWAKVEPKPGVWDLAAIAHYRDQIRELQKRGISPMITLHHFTFPQWVRNQGGFEWEGLPEAFSRFVALVATEIGPQVQDWITINEPMVHLVLGYVSDRQPPNRRGESREIEAIIPPLRGLLATHALAYRTLKDIAKQQNREVRVGMAHHLRAFDPSIIFDGIAADIFDYAFNWMVPLALETGRLQWPMGQKMVLGLLGSKLGEVITIAGLRGTQDFLGINYYTRDFVKMDLNQPPSKWLKTVERPQNWEIYAQGLVRVLKEAHRRIPRLQILITENGVADAEDSKRVLALEQHLYAVHLALREGVPVVGYCHWSLMDNFEWSLGVTPRFGLYSVDYYNGFARTARPSALRFSEIAKSGSAWVQPFALEATR